MKKAIIFLVCFSGCAQQITIRNINPSSLQGQGTKLQVAGTNSGAPGAILCNSATGSTTTNCSFIEVRTWNGRSGDVSPTNGDYSASQITNAADLSGSNVFIGQNIFNGLAYFSNSITSSAANTWTGFQNFSGNMGFGGSSTWIHGTQNFLNADHTIPFKVGTSAAKPGTCTSGEMYFATDVTNGQNLFMCNPGNTWTQQINTGAVPQVFSSITTGTNTSAHMTLGSGSILDSTGTAIINFSGSSHTSPVLTGLIAGLPVTCSVGEIYFASNATAGQNLYFCNATNTWTQQLNSGGGGGSSFTALSGGTNTTAHMTIGSGAVLDSSGTAVINFSISSHTFPVLTDVVGSIPATCGMGELYFASDATAGQNLYMCTATNTWTQQLNTGGNAAFSSLTNGTNTTAAMLVGTGASLKTSGTGVINATSLVDSAQLNAVVALATPTAVNYFGARNAATGTPVSLEATGSDADISIKILGRGAGVLYLNSLSAHLDTGGNLTVATCTGCGGGGSSLPFIDSFALLKNVADTTKQGRFDLTSVSTGTTRVWSMQNASYTLAGTDIAQSFSAVNTFNRVINANTGSSTEPSIIALSTSNTQPTIQLHNFGTYYGIYDTSAVGSFFSKIYAGNTATYLSSNNLSVNNTFDVLSSTGQIDTYAAYNTQGTGVAPIYVSSFDSGGTTMIGTGTNTFTMSGGGNPPSGMYRVCGYAQLVAPFPNIGTVAINIFFNNGSGNLVLILVSGSPSNNNWNTGCGVINTDGAHIVQYQFQSQGTAHYHVTIERVR